MHRLAATRRPRLSETEPKWFVFKISWYMRSVGDIALNLLLRKTKRE